MHNYRNARVLVLLATMAFGGLVLVNVVASISTWSECGLLQRAIEGVEEVTEAEAEANDLRQGFIALVYTALRIATVVIFCFWLYRANKNAQALGAQEMQFTPGWSVGYFFIPIVNLYRPYQAVNEIMRASDPDAQPISDKPWQDSSAALVGWWWAAWLASNVVGQVAFRLAMRAETLEETLRSSQVMLVSDIIDIPSAMLALAVVWAIQSRQTQRAARLNQSNAASLERSVLAAPAEKQWPGLQR